MRSKLQKHTETANLSTKKLQLPFVIIKKIKIHEAIAFTAIAPLLNLNLNYEKLRHKNRKSFHNKKHKDVFFRQGLLLDNNSPSRSDIFTPICSLSTSR